MNRAELVGRLRAAVVRDGLLAQGDRVVVGVSGGPDSMALLHGLVALGRDGGFGLELHVAHLNHKIRGADADADAEFVAEAARRLGLPCTVHAEDIPALARSENRGLEEVARRQRYRFFERVCLQVGSNIVAVGHQADDHAETILHRIVRGTGLRGLGGIRPQRPLHADSQVRLVRPLLGFRHSELVAFLAAEGIAYRLDRTNLDVRQTRSRIRTQILPRLAAELNPQVVEALVRLGEQARWVQEYLSDTASRLFETLLIHRDEEALVLNAETLSRKHRAVQLELIRQAIAGFQLGEGAITYKHLLAVAELLDAACSGKRVQLPCGLIATQRYGRLILQLRPALPTRPALPEVTLRVPGQTSVPAAGVRIAARVQALEYPMLAEWKQHRSVWQQWLDHDRVHLPLTVRSPRPGDRFHPLGAPGSKTLADFFTDAKVAPARRAEALVVCDRLGPIWVVPFRIDDRVKLTPSTRRVLELTVCGQTEQGAGRGVPEHQPCKPDGAEAC